MGLSSRQRAASEVNETGVHHAKAKLNSLSQPLLLPISFAEILNEIPRLSFAERQELVRRAIALDDSELTAEENALLDARMEDFRRNPDAGIPPKPALPGAQPPDILPP